MLTLYQNLAIMMYVGHELPFKSKFINMHELVNEIFIMTVTTNLILFSDFVLDPNTKYDYGGWSYVILICLCIAFNLLILLFKMAKSVRLVVIKYFRRYKPSWWDKVFKPKQCQIPEQKITKETARCNLNIFEN